MKDEGVNARTMFLYGGFELKQSRLGWGEFFANFRKPCGMGEIAAAYNRDAFPAGPQCQVLQIAVAAGGQGIFRMHVQVGVEHCQCK